MSWRYGDDAFDWDPDDPWRDVEQGAEGGWSAALDTVVEPLRQRVLEGWAAFRRDAEERGIAEALAALDVSERELRLVLGDYTRELRRRGQRHGSLAEQEVAQLVDAFVLGVLHGGARTPRSAARHD